MVPAARRPRPARHAINKSQPKALPLPKNITFISLEVYGTLIDWETGIYNAFQKEAEKDGFTIDRDRLIPMFVETQAEIMSGSYELYAEVLRRTAVRCAEELGWELEPVRSSFLPDSIPRWMPFRDTNALLERLKKKYPGTADAPGGVGLISNIDDKLLGATRRHLRPDFDLVVTAQQVRSYKPDPAHFKECQRRIGTGAKKTWVHIATSMYTDIQPCMKAKIPHIWVNKKKEKLEGQKKPDAEVKDLRAAVTMLKA